MTKIGINGFGRIGRCTLKHLMSRKGVEVVGINDLADIGDLAYLLKYDSVHGWYPLKVSDENNSIQVGDRNIHFFSESDPKKIPWKSIGVDIVLECTGVFRKREAAAGHLAAGAKKVIISAPMDDADGTFVLGVNHKTYDPSRHHIVSNASCTTNSLAPVAKVLHDRFKVEHLMITTVHAYTSSQSLMDIPTRKRRRGRSASLSIVPTTTGAARATALVIPDLKGRMDGMALRVPVPDGSITDIVATLGSTVSADGVNQALRDASQEDHFAGILRVSDEALVSRDIIGDPHSSIVDAESTLVLRDRVAKVLAWYDNEWGYSARLADFAQLMVEKGL
ncbi:MAG: type I glyceraldehyde-3-phosphate dehydrogenase [Candidatus Eisenbacteria bacterium]|uniref:Glyceraldehyde-3-phosphate dehydrogenase n=1 Tax=Eiseniibacteriota bacterium TaxID=2212470 RepID=A0A948W6I9_UNCEI|nr:type I glyceraldehyde-3-phosphate dehydrogenase [Candidatus Eisenbacteria bacterium]MBU1950507.1 type I glyceraldehyde-3-phosphate dehydrogenase [Candidatus Eisenbacteria bacterium]MBU2691180.1 type I glyceraldehyde-3-phosphate dehydrogenase [Candidatus Eisenbacteria bacterium]